MTDEEMNEFSYHLRELRADFGLIRSELVNAESADNDRSLHRAWIGAWALLEHDLEVHIPAALALLNRTLPMLKQDEIRPFAVRETRQLVESAMSALPSIDVDPALAVDHLTDIAGAIHQAFQIAAETIKTVSQNEEPGEEGA